MDGSKVLSSHSNTLTCWPTPTGLGETLMNAYVGISHDGVCAVAGRNVAVAPIEAIKMNTIEIAAVLFLQSFTFLILLKVCELDSDTQFNIAIYLSI